MTMRKNEWLIKSQAIIQRRHRVDRRSGLSKAKQLCKRKMKAALLRHAIDKLTLSYMCRLLHWQTDRTRNNPYDQPPVFEIHLFCHTELRKGQSIYQHGFLRDAIMIDECSLGKILTPSLALMGMNPSGRIGRCNNGSLRQVCFEKVHNMFATQRTRTHRLSCLWSISEHLDVQLRLTRQTTACVLSR